MDSLTCEDKMMVDNISSSELVDNMRRLSHLFTNTSINQQTKKRTAAEIRLKKDLNEVLTNRMNTKSFHFDISELTKESDGTFSLNVKFTKVGDSDRFHSFLLLFNLEYPYSPPQVKLINTSDPAPLNYQNLKLKFLTKENWSPVLTLNTTLFALELSLLYPDDDNHTYLNSINLHEKEEQFFKHKKLSQSISENKAGKNKGEQNNSNFNDFNDFNDFTGKIVNDNLSKSKISILSNIDIINMTSCVGKRKFSDYNKSNKNDPSVNYGKESLNKKFRVMKIEDL